MTTELNAGSETAAVAARLDRLPSCSYLKGLTARIALGGWFEFYEMFMAGYIALGLVDGGLFTETSRGYFDLTGFASFTGLFFAGMFLSTVLFSRVSDRYGRRATFTFSMLGYSVAAVLVAVSSTPALIDLFRFLAGFAIGIQLITNDTYISELAPRPVRGRYMAIGYVVILTAVPTVALLSWLLVPRSPLGLAGWRWVMLIGAAGGVLVWLVRRGLPESPRWLASRGRVVEAERVLADIEHRVAAQTGPLPDPAPEPPLPADSGRGWREIFGRRYGPRTALLSVFQFAQTIAVYGFANWAPLLLVKHGFTVVHSLGYSFMIALLTPVGGLAAMLFAERVERKWQLVLTAVGIGAFGMLFAEARATVLILIGGAAVTLFNNWLIGIFHSYQTELFPTRIRAQAVGFSFSWSRISAIFASYWIADLLAAYGTTGVFTLIAAAMVAIIVSMSIWGPRTNNRPLEQLSP